MLGVHGRGVYAHCYNILRWLLLPSFPRGHSYFSGVFTSEDERSFVREAWRRAGEAVAAATGVARFDAGTFNSVFTGFGGAWEPTFLEALAMACDSFPADK